MMDAEALVKAGRLGEALEALQARVRSEPANADLRVFLFQLLSVLGRWDRALTQLNVAAELDAKNLLMAQVCRTALNCEALRGEIFAGRRSPMIFGEPAPWVGWLVQANQLCAEGRYAAAAALRDRAFEAAPAIAGAIDGQPFAWIADADTRLGPLLEAIIDGRYYWVPFGTVREVLISPPTDLRDAVWTPAQFVWTNGGTAPGLIPTRYPGSEASDDDALRLARKTAWVEGEAGYFLGLGQRVLASDQGEYPLLETRRIALTHDEAEAPPKETDDGGTHAAGSSAAVPPDAADR